MQTATARRIGAYRIEREIGAGETGAVYLGSRADREFEKRVAIKLAREGERSEAVLKRFRVERQTLAKLEHSNIARLLDAGITEDGDPYIVMEFAEGLPLDEFCARENLPLGRRLALFRKICSAVQYAHQRLVVHRDLKSRNILVNREGEPKLVGFGEGDATQTAATTSGDVYALGLLLRDLVGEKHGDLDKIVAMALGDEPERRYRSAAELGEDVRRYQEHLPVSARKETIGYIAGKLIARHKIASAAAFTTAMGMLVLTVVLAAEIRKANSERARAERITAYMQQILGGNVANHEKKGRDLKVVDILRDAAAGLDLELKNQPLEAAELHATIGNTFGKLGMLPAADRELRAGLRAQGAVLGPNSTVTAETLHTLGVVERYEGQYADSEQHLRRALRIEQRNGASSSGDAMNDLAVTLYVEGRYKECGAYLEQLLAESGKFYKAGDVRLDILRNNIAAVRFERGDFAGAAEIQREVVNAHRERDRRAGSLSLELGLAEMNLSRYLRSSGDASAAAPHAVSALQIYKQRVGDSHTNTAFAECELASVYSEEGWHARAEEEARNAVAAASHALPPGHPTFANVWVCLGRVLTAAGKPAAAERYLREAFAMREKKGSPTRVAEAADALALCLIGQNRLREARPFAETAYLNFKNVYGENNRITRAAFERLKNLPSGQL